MRGLVDREHIPDSDSPSTIDERRTLLRDLIDDGVKKFVYEYDFGDDWLHDVVIERVSDAEPDTSYPRCLAGKGACPPEDCGGPSGYRDLLLSLEEPDDDEYADLREWAGDWTPRPFNLDAVNLRLSRARRGA